MYIYINTLIHTCKVFLYEYIMNYINLIPSKSHLIEWKEQNHAGNRLTGGRSENCIPLQGSCLSQKNKKNEKKTLLFLYLFPFLRKTQSHVTRYNTEVNISKHTDVNIQNIQNWLFKRSIF